MQRGELTGRSVGGRFVVERLAGEGGMGAVYRATDTTTGAPVALKVIGAAYRDAADRFDREIAVLASLDHPGIVRHVGHGRTEDDLPFLAMEWLDGEDLAARLARGPLPIDEAIALVSRAAHALAEVHARGIVHRDVKPSNVFLRGGSVMSPVLLDFGVARRAEARTVLTLTGNLLGTPQYMAPEQVQGARDLGPRSDVFALGCVLFECLAGRPAFAGEHALAILTKILVDEPPAIRSLVRGVPLAVDELLQTMLAKRPEDRPSSCLEVATRLAAVSLGSTTGQPTSSALAPLTSRERRLVSVVLVREAADEDELTMGSVDLARERDGLRTEIEALGGRLTQVGPSSLVVTMPSAGAAVDHATAAAKCAHVILRTLPHATIALAMGWAEIDPLPVGEVIDRAAEMLSRARGMIHVDEVSAGLLELRFDLDGEPGQRTLKAERSSAEPPRTLLGKPTPCVGRDRELSVLLGLMGEVVSDGVARVAQVTAAAGVGKSRLRHELCTRIARDHRDALLLVARAEAFRANASLDMIGQIVREGAGIGPDDDDATARARLAARAACVSALGREPSEIAALLGEIASVHFDDAASPRLAAARRDNRVIGELMLDAWLTWLGAEVAQHPVVLVFEDLHWADGQTVRYVDMALREHAERPVFVLAVARPDVRERFPALWKDRAVQEIALPPLTARAAERLVRAALTSLPAPDVDRIVRQAEGNPLYIEEMVRAAASGATNDAPASVVAMMQSRLESFDASARRVMRAASVFGESFLVDDVCALVTDGEDVRAVVALLVDREVVSRRPHDGELAFRHALLREAAYAMFTPDDRERAHALAAQHLEARGDTEAVVLAEHYDLARDTEHAAIWYASAAREALRKNDFDAAIARANASLARGGTTESRATAVGARGKARACLGAWIDASRDLDEALALVSDPARRLEYLEDLLFVSTFRQDSALMRRAGGEALALAEGMGRNDIAAEANIALSIAEHAEGDCEASVTRFRSSISRTREPPGPVVGLASIMLYHVAGYVEGETVTRKMLTVARDLGDLSTQIILIGNLGLSLAGQGRYAEAMDSFERGRALATKFGVHTLAARTVSMTAGYPLDTYDLEETERRAQETKELGRALEFATPRINACLDLAYVAARRGRADEAEALAAEVGDEIAAGKGFHGWIWRSRLGVLYAELFALRGDWKNALRHSASCIAGCDALLRVKYRLLAEHVHTRALAALGRHEEALATARRSLEEARRYPDPAMMMRAAAALLDLGEDERARSELAGAAARIENSLPDESARRAFRDGAPLERLG